MVSQRKGRWKAPRCRFRLVVLSVSWSDGSGAPHRVWFRLFTLKILRITSDPYASWRATGLSSRANGVLVNCGYKLPADALAAGPAAVMARLREYRCQKWRPNCGVVTLREIREWLGWPSDELKTAGDELLKRVPDDALIAELRRRGYRITDTPRSS